MTLDPGVKFLVDVNLPYKFRLWHDKQFFHVKDIDDEWSDSQIWRFAKERKLRASLNFLRKDFISLVLSALARKFSEGAQA